MRTGRFCPFNKEIRRKYGNSGGKVAKDIRAFYRQIGAPKQIELKNPGGQIQSNISGGKRGLGGGTDRQMGGWKNNREQNSWTDRNNRDVDNKLSLIN